MLPLPPCSCYWEELLCQRKFCAECRIQGTLSNKLVNQYVFNYSFLVEFLCWTVALSLLQRKARSVFSKSEPNIFGFPTVFFYVLVQLYMIASASSLFTKRFQRQISFLFLLSILIINIGIIVMCGPVYFTAF